MKKISVIIPCYNVHDYIDRCMNTIVNQTLGMEYLEIILVDDCSTDKTFDKLEEWEKRYPENIMVISCDQNGRQGTARNIGLSYSSGDYITFVDSDDWIELDMLEKMYKVIDSTGVEIVSAQYGRDRGDGVFCYTDDYEGPMNQVIQINSKEERKAIVQIGLSAGVSGKLYRRDFIFNNQLFFPEGLTYEDNYYIMMVLFDVNSYVVLENRFYHYFINESSTVSTANSSHQFDRLKISIMIDEELKLRGYEADYKDEIEAYFLNTYYINTLHIVFTRFDVLPYQILDNMQREVLERYPQCLSDSATKLLGERGNVMLST